MALDSKTWRIAHLNLYATVVRDSDRARLGFETAIMSASTNHVELAANVEMRRGEPLQIECRNLLQRFRKRVEGTVVDVYESTQQGVWIVRLELRVRFTPSEVRLLKPRQPPFSTASQR